MGECKPLRRGARGAAELAAAKTFMHEGVYNVSAPLTHVHATRYLAVGYVYVFDPSREKGKYFICK